MLSKTYAPALFGVDGRLISIECDITNGLPGFVVVGLGDKAVEESRERVRSAIKNTGLIIPPRRITLNLAPADLPKDGSGYDLGMAVAILAASGQIDPSVLEDSLFLGELALDGSLRPVKGAVMAAQLTSQQSLKRLFVPMDNAVEAGIIEDTKVFAVSNLLELYRHLTGVQVLSAVSVGRPKAIRSEAAKVDFSLIYGQKQAKRAIEIAAAGNHNILLSGPPGTGKTLLAKAAMSILPKPSLEEMIEITKLHNLAGRTKSGIMRERPFRAPHHTASSVALIGGGTKPRPGEISLSHGGVLFLDELPEFPRDVLEVLRQPLEDGSITVARAAGVTTFPARFMLIATRNPCPCGFHGDPETRCHCKEATIALYQRKLSGPLLDRIDMLIDVMRIDSDAIIRGHSTENSTTVAARVAAARTIQTDRFTETPTLANAYMTSADIKKYCKIDNETAEIAAQAMRQLSISARGYTRTLKVARTIADLEGCDSIKLQHFTEALQYRPRLGEKKPSDESAKPEPFGRQHYQPRYAS
jgi:magnesium chelatase family protein